MANDACRWMCMTDTAMYTFYIIQYSNNHLADTYISIYMCVCVCVCVCMAMSVCMHVILNVCVCVCVCVHDVCTCAHAFTPSYKNHPDHVEKKSWACSPTWAWVYVCVYVCMHAIMNKYMLALCMAESKSLRSYKRNPLQCSTICPWVWVCMSVCMHACMYIYTHVCLHTCLYVYMHACIFCCGGNHSDHNSKNPLPLSHACPMYV